MTEVALARGSGQDNVDATIARDLLADETDPLTVLGDTAYGTAELREPPKPTATPW